MNAYPYLEAVRGKSPVVHHLTNWVTIYDCAQVVKSFGASPVMAHAPEEVADMAGIASALVLNMGTLTAEFIDSMKLAAAAANRKGMPVVLDVCGTGATHFRNKMSFELLDAAKINIIKGNSSEIARIAGRDVQTRGVDATEVRADLGEIASFLAKERLCTVVITGKEDIVADSKSVYRVKNGHEMMSHVVGTGCMAASVIGTFAGASPDDLTAAAAAGLCCYEIAAELAMMVSGGPGSFKPHLFDCIFNLKRDDVDSLQKITP
ncbi:MAG TPA: hydroxyethylthiazole kinase [Spirochaetota bacterium]|mgnify:CR=1 FL=1|nr:hydroxyethylthiazole kinase [Spirochaetota bacterium]HPC40305.1 hydroxyethylthiazole kinase [Spirochaetota bacterium]HPL15348.1 hydroxyethylthiazole kinase [Spirochaetota bacterium]HQF07221.1 hydroxyethylthiazole kinase [Spirochaetota bacterium]HQH96121.1 hydroxyethylthiazole kinase [Spirochaetota bacterium]